MNIIIVCTGNICRSPLAAQLLRRGMADTAVQISSAGTRTRHGSPMDAQAAEIAERLGVSESQTSEHLSRPLDPELLREVDLVVALDRSHRRAVVELAPAVTRRTFTLRELARLSGGVSDEEFQQLLNRYPSEEASHRLAAMLMLIAGRRGFAAQPDDPTIDDVVDPFGRSTRVHLEAASAILASLPPLERLLRLALA